MSKLAVILSVQITNTVFDGVPVTIYSPREKGEELTGGLVLLHGGGFMSGSASKNFRRIIYAL